MIATGLRRGGRKVSESVHAHPARRGGSSGEHAPVLAEHGVSRGRSGAPDAGTSVSRRQVAGDPGGRRSRRPSDAGSHRRTWPPRASGAEHPACPADASRTGATGGRLPANARAPRACSGEPVRAAVALPSGGSTAGSRRLRARRSPRKPTGEGSPIHLIHGSSLAWAAAGMPPPSSRLQRERAILLQPASPGHPCRRFVHRGAEQATVRGDRASREAPAPARQALEQPDRPPSEIRTSNSSIGRYTAIQAVSHSCVNE